MREEKRNILTFPPRLVAEQLTVMDAVSRGALGVGQAFPLPSAVQPAFPDPNSRDLGPNHNSPSDHPWVLGNFLNPQAFAAHLWPEGVDTHSTSCSEWLQIR